MYQRVSFGQKIQSKLQGSLRRCFHFFRWFPTRTRRLLRHFTAIREQSTGRWLIELTVMIFDLLGLAEIYETLADWIKWNTRPLTTEERRIGQSIFGESLDWERVRIDNRAYLGPRQYQVCYVSGYTINSWGEMPGALLVHELTHVWQFHHFGLAYIPRALRAYHSEIGYDYGGAAALERVRTGGGQITDFNYEQQGDIMADYYRLRIGRPPQWGFAGMDALPVYEYFLKDLQRS